MADGSKIEWTEATWNPVVGCSKVSPGCAYCYAETLTMRLAGEWGVPGLPWTPENAEANVILKPKRLDQPLRWKKPRLIFVNSMSDLFHELVPDDYVAEVFSVMADASQHVFQVLTKRPERMRDLLLNPWFWERVGAHRAIRSGTLAITDMPLSNVWLGTSIENRQFVGRADVLRETPAAIRFISAEPLLGPLVPKASIARDIGTLEYDGESAHVEKRRVTDHYWDDGHTDPGLDLTDIDWLIVGGESAGPMGRRLTDEFGPKSEAKRWVSDLRDAAQRAGAAFFLKQWGGRTPKAGGRLLDGREWNEMPTALPSAQEVGV